MVTKKPLLIKYCQVMGRTNCLLTVWFSSLEILRDFQRNMLLMNVIANIQHIYKFYFILSLGLLFFNSHDGGPYHIDWTGFYMIGISVMKELKKSRDIFLKCDHAKSIQKF